jgi:hypothetical protein
MPPEPGWTPRLSMISASCAYRRSASADRAAVLGVAPQLAAYDEHTPEHREDRHAQCRADQEGYQHCGRHRELPQCLLSVCRPRRM